MPTEFFGLTFFDFWLKFVSTSLIGKGDELWEWWKLWDMHCGGMIWLLVSWNFLTITEWISSACYESLTMHSHKPRAHVTRTSENRQDTWVFFIENIAFYNLMTCIDLLDFWKDMWLLIILGLLKVFFTFEEVSKNSNFKCFWKHDELTFHQISKTASAIMKV